MFFDVNLINDQLQQFYLTAIFVFQIQFLYYRIMFFKFYIASNFMVFLAMLFVANVLCVLQDVENCHFVVYRRLVVAQLDFLQI